MLFLESDNNLAHSLADCIAREDWQAASELAAQRFEMLESVRLRRAETIGIWFGVNIAFKPGALTFHFGKCIDDPNARWGLLLRLVMYFPQIACFISRSSDREGEIDLNLGDAEERPGLSFCSTHPDAVLVPDPVFVGTRGYETIRLHFDQNPIPWTARKPVAFWRGATTGLPNDPIGWRSMPRLQLCELGQQFPEVFDVGITQIAGVNDDPLVIRDYLEQKDFLRPYVPTENMPQFKYQIDIDGYTNSWPGLFTKLLSGSPVLKILSPLGWRQWYYDRLKEWEHFVPVESPGDDLVEKVAWLRKNDDAAQRIGASGGALAQSMTFESEIVRGAEIIEAFLWPVAREEFVQGA
jgi:hypothetical protein